jgi:hypothetical protein
MIACQIGNGKDGFAPFGHAERRAPLLHNDLRGQCFTGK